MATNGNNQNPWPPYNNYKDCSLGICTFYCPQFCYLNFPPPPENDDSTPFSPLIIAVIGMLASAFLLVSYYTIVTRYCKRRNVHTEENEDEENMDVVSQRPFHVAAVGLDEVLIKSITVFRYKKEEGLVEGSECSVCLSEFEENECLRLLPKCDHAFHLPCIDTWLKSHSTCPMCRASVVSLPYASQNQVLTTVSVNAYEIQRPNDSILVVDEERSFSDAHESEEDLDSRTRNVNIRRSISLGTFSSQQRLMMSDVMKIDDDASRKVIGPSDELMKRSASTGGH